MLGFFMAADKLVQIPRSDLPQLRDLFLLDWPKHIIEHGLVDNYIRWFEQDPHYGDVTIYSLNGDWSDGTFAVIVSSNKIRKLRLL